MTLTPLCPTCPVCELVPLQLNILMGYWECYGYTADERFAFWVFDEKGRLQEVSGDTYVDDDGSLKKVPTSQEG